MYKNEIKNIINAAVTAAKDSQSLIKLTILKYVYLNQRRVNGIKEKFRLVPKRNVQVKVDTTTEGPSNINRLFVHFQAHGSECTSYF